ASEAQHLAVRCERVARRQLPANRPARAIRSERVGRLEEQRLGAVAIRDEEDLVVRPRLFQRRRETEQARGGAGVARPGDDRLLRHGRLGKLELSYERSVCPRVRTIEHQLGDVFLLAPGLFEETGDRLGNVQVEAMRLDERRVGKRGDVAVAVVPPDVSELMTHAEGARERRDDALPTAHAPTAPVAPPRPPTAGTAPAPGSGSSPPPGAAGRMSPAAPSASRADPAATASSARRSAVVPERSDPVMSAVRMGIGRSTTVARSVALDFS